ncbi:hypothetical protein CDEF62S_01842 [Castellaniella defragrans]
MNAVVMTSSTMAVVRIADKIALLIMRIVSERVAAAMTRAPISPREAASVGVANPR